MLKSIQEIAIEAGEEILRFYHGGSAIDYKADNSPLTLADKAAHRLICERLNEFNGDIPILSEESDPEEISERKTWKRFWLVDPLDGTKEFIKKTGEFTVNIALVVDGKAVLGVVYVPTKKVTYMAEGGMSAYRQQTGHPREQIHTRKTDSGNLTMVASRDHAGPHVKALLEAYPDAESTSMGSSLKFCLVAEGKADVYLRDVPTMEWDTAAAQCIVETAGGRITDLEGTPLTYNKEDLRNPALLTIGDPDGVFSPEKMPQVLGVGLR